MTITPHEATASRASARLIRWAWFLALVFFAASAQAQTLTIYDDALANGFDGPNYSFGGGFDFNSAVQHHTGAKSISILGQKTTILFTDDPLKPTY
jgi:hypothetical protein